MSTSINYMSEHLVSLGYKVQIIPSKNPSDREIFVATHDLKNNIVFFEIFPSFVMFRVNLATERKFSPGMDSFINSANKIFSLARMYYDIEADKAILRMESIFTGDYSRECFSTFVEVFSTDQAAIYKMSNFEEIFLGTDTR